MEKDENCTSVQIFVKKLTVVHVSTDVATTFKKKKKQNFRGLTLRGGAATPRPKRIIKKKKQNFRGLALRSGRTTPKGRMGGAVTPKSQKKKEAKFRGFGHWFGHPQWPNPIFFFIFFIWPLWVAELPLPNKPQGWFGYPRPALGVAQTSPPPKWGWHGWGALSCPKEWLGQQPQMFFFFLGL
jgi:hypothetical protein